MELTFAPKGRLQIDDARIAFRNFRGEGDKFNRAGDRTFVLIIPTEEIADALVAEGWNVKIKDPKEDGDVPFMYLTVKVKFNDRGPQVYLKTGDRVNRLDEESVSILDDVDILSVNMDIRPYDWEVNGKTGRTAYLQSIEVIQEIDRFAARYAESESREQNMLLYERRVMFMVLRIKIIIAELIRKVCCISPKWGNRVIDILGYDNYCRVAKYWK